MKITGQEDRQKVLAWAEAGVRLLQPGLHPIPIQRNQREIALLKEGRFELAAMGKIKHGDPTLPAPLPGDRDGQLAPSSKLRACASGPDQVAECKGMMLRRNL